MEAIRIQPLRLDTVEALEVPVVLEEMQLPRQIEMMVVLALRVVEMPVPEERELKQVPVGQETLLLEKNMAAAELVLGVLVLFSVWYLIAVKAAPVHKVVYVLSILMWSIVLRWQTIEIQYVAEQCVNLFLR